MAKHAVLIVLALCVAAATASSYYDVKTADKKYIENQLKIYNLVYHVAQPEIVNPNQYQQGLSWNFEEKLDFYTNKDAVQEFLKLYKNGLLPKGEMFSVYYPKILEESIALFRIFYYAKDFDTFFNTALWARGHVNEGSYLCALYQAVIRRPDTKYLQLPPPYEFYPYAFFNSEVIEKAKAAHFYKKKIPASDGYESYEPAIIHANYSGWYLNRNYDLESKLNYFTEDIGLNAYYFFFRQDFPFWLKSEEFGIDKNYRGEIYLYGHQQLLTRYYLERFANGLDKIEDFSWGSEFYPGYYPSMNYHNGMPFPQRPQWSKIPHYKYKYAKYIHEIEARISAAIDLGYIIDADGKQVKIYTPEGLNIFGNLIEGNADSCNKDFYGSIDTLARKILGFNLEPKSDYQIFPSALESFASSMRDPAFYRIYQRIYYYFFWYKNHLKPYKKEEVVFPEVVIDTVAVDKLMTYFDDFDATISNGLLVEDQKEADTFLVKVRQQRLNHKPFSVHLGITPAKAGKYSIQLFLGPKYNSKHELLDFSQSYKFFYEIDYWLADLTAGPNKIERSSKEFYFTSPDPLPSEDIWKSVQSAMMNNKEFEYQPRIFGFPQRLLLPKGRRAGADYQLFVYVAPVVGEPVQYSSRVFGDYQFNNKAIGSPLDRPIDKSYFQGPNIFFKDVVIYHKYDSDINTTT